MNPTEESGIIKQPAAYSYPTHPWSIPKRTYMQRIYILHDRNCPSFLSTYNWSNFKMFFGENTSHQLASKTLSAVISFRKNDLHTSIKITSTRILISTLRNRIPRPLDRSCHEFPHWWNNPNALEKMKMLMIFRDLLQFLYP